MGSSQDGHRPSVLVVDQRTGLGDDVIACLVAARPSTVTQVERLVDALVLLRVEPFDVVIVHPAFTDARRVDTVASLHYAAPKSALIVIGDGDDEHTVLRALREGAQEYLVADDVNAHSLRRTVRIALERKAAERRRLDGPAHATHVDGLDDALANRTDPVRRARAHRCVRAYQAARNWRS